MPIGLDPVWHALAVGWWRREKRETKMAVKK
jgi:hypothetical protein